MWLRRGLWALAGLALWGCRSRARELPVPDGSATHSPTGQLPAAPDAGSLPQRDAGMLGVSAAPRVDAGTDADNVEPPSPEAPWDGIPDAYQPEPTAPVRPEAGAMVLIPGGTFTMGRKAKKGEEQNNEGPPHSVTLKDFMMDATEVTVAAYRLCAEAKGCPQRPNWPRCPNDTEHDRHPVRCLSHEESVAFCAWAGKRLPSEAEWEYAARGPEGRLYPWGAQAPKGRLCWSGDFKNRFQHRTEACEVGQYPAGNTPQGVNDLAGNVWERTATQWCDDYTHQSCSSRAHIARGAGYWHSGEQFTRGTFRMIRPDNMRDPYTGFRCVRTAERTLPSP